MLDAFELFHYAWKFRSSRLLLILEPGCSLDSILPDIKLLQRAHIPFLLLSSAASLRSADVDTFIERGLPLAPVSAGNITSDSLPSLQAQVLILLEKHEIPILLVEGEDSENSSDLERVLAAATLLATALEIQKTFFLNTRGSLSLDGKTVSHLPSRKLEERLQAGSQCNFSPLLTSTALAIAQDNDREFVFLEASKGALFTELFTHRGSGTLLTNSYSNAVRTARVSDVYDMMLLMNPAMNEGSVLHYSEEQIAADISSFSVYSVNDSIVATAKLNDYGEAAELGKFCTLPRYRGKGRARELARHLIDNARKQGKRYVFGLSTSEEMWRFFLALGFQEIDRDSLPEEWKKNYDFTRLSKAFSFQL